MIELGYTVIFRGGLLLRSWFLDSLNKIGDVKYSN